MSNGRKRKVDSGKPGWRARRRERALAPEHLRFSELLKPKTFGEAETEPIGTTSNHPFSSVDRTEFVQAGSLEIGERLQTLNGDVKVVQQKLPHPGPQPVFNLEVHNEHVYFVGEDGVLVHNAKEYNELLKQTPRGKAGHGEWSGRRGESRYTSSRANTNGVSVVYQGARPDFRNSAKYTLYEVDIASFVNSHGKRGARRALHAWADAQVAAKLNNGQGVNPALISRFREKMKFTWHEVNGTTMQLIPTRMNKNFPHLVGISEAANP